jgi:hypothetical protein
MTMKYISLLLTVIMLACAGTKEPVKKTTDTVPESKYDESFDPQSLNDDDIVINSEKSTTVTQNNAEDTAIIAVEKKKREVNGFRVQILATSNIETASLTEQEATDRFDKLEQNTYLLFEAPLYKVRIGDCLKRNEAEELREMALSFGYTGAFIVKTKVISEQ